MRIGGWLENVPAAWSKRMPSPSDTEDFKLQQFQSLRAELVERISGHRQYLSLALAAFGALIAVSGQRQSPIAALIYPLIALFLSAGWIHNHLRTRQIATFVRDYEKTLFGEQNADKAGWENYLRGGPQVSHQSWLGHANFWTAMGTFAGTEACALFAAYVYGALANGPRIAAFAVGVVAFVVTIYVVAQYRTQAEVEPSSPQSTTPARDPTSR
jgi:hypothetical protein